MTTVIEPIRVAYIYTTFEDMVDDFTSAYLCFRDEKNFSNYTLSLPGSIMLHFLWTQDPEFKTKVNSMSFRGIVYVQIQNSELMDFVESRRKPK